MTRGRGRDRAPECSTRSLLQGGWRRPGTRTSQLELGRACESQDGTEWGKEYHGFTKPCFLLCSEIWPAHFPVWGWERWHRSQEPLTLPRGNLFLFTDQTLPWGFRLTNLCKKTPFSQGGPQRTSLQGVELLNSLYRFELCNNRASLQRKKKSQHVLQIHDQHMVVVRRRLLFAVWFQIPPASFLFPALWPPSSPSPASFNFPPNSRLIWFPTSPPCPDHLTHSLEQWTEPQPQEPLT